MNNRQEEAEWSKLMFQQHVKPLLEKECPYFKHGQIVTVERAWDFKDKGVEKLLDTDAGFDYMLANDTGLKGIASRVLRGKYRNFTLRKERLKSHAITEYDKLISSRKNNTLRPYYHVQGYMDVALGSLWGVAVTKTDDLIDFVLDHPELESRTTNKGDAEFIPVRWDDLLGEGIDVWIKMKPTRKIW